MTKRGFLIDEPGYISFSGGRTSGYMLWRILEAHGGSIPPSVHVLFSNTGKEMPGTIDFVHDIERHWGIDIAWCEYRLTEDDKPTYAVVDYESACRIGTPFDLYLDHVERMTASKGNDPYLPGPGNRFCTTELKIRVMKKWMLDRGYEYWTNVVGIRYDEPKRWRKIDRTAKRERWEVDLPLVDNLVTVDDVREFWSRQPFDLNLNGDWEGNCDACHLKTPWKIAQIFRDYPERAKWWLEREHRAGKMFRPRGPSIEQLVELSRLPVVRESSEFEIQCVTCTD